MAADGLTTLQSRFRPKETMDRLEACLSARGMTVFARIDHAAGAIAAGLTLRPTEVLIFGHAKAGTPLMQAVQTIGIDLPLKALVWQDASGDTWLSKSAIALTAPYLFVAANIVVGLIALGTLRLIVQRRLLPQAAPMATRQGISA